MTCSVEYATWTQDTFKLNNEAANKLCSDVVLQGSADLEFLRRFKSTLSDLQHYNHQCYNGKITRHLPTH
ncbi:Cytadherence high molecular weight protein 1 [Dissostichus eleginoides]|uniref:Cytadherence high molecular weight protein 1 n=1 Tax=Dissostichus eleginoides TaxID=100907 RepID=A0AAD9BK52_DISEL|nr:Cytadherence high molecular weight protein 1 [Dissostichus eleginoides]